MVKKLTESALKQSPVNLSKTLFSLTACIVFRSAFGQNYFESKQISKEKIEQLMFEAIANVTFKFTDFFPVAGIGWFIDFVLGEHKRLRNVFLEVDTFVRKVADDHLKNKHGETTPDRPDIVDVMLGRIQKQEQGDSFKLTTDHLHGVISDLFTAGVDTSAIIMIWAMAELIRNPRVMKKAQDEIRASIRIKPEERITEEDLDKVQYLKPMVKETLRLHPPAPLLVPRETMSPIKIQGYNIPPKTLVMVNTWTIAHDPKHWENPEEFIPERFMDCPVDYKGHSFEMLPFGSGRRMCPGMAFGIATVELGLLNLLYFFDWKLPEESKGVDMEEAGDVTIVKKSPLELVPILRTRNTRTIFLLVIGNLHQIKGLLHTCLYDPSKKHGPMMLLPLGVVRMIVITSSEGTEEVLKTHDLECCTRPTTIALKTFSRNGNDIGAGVYGETWRELRSFRFSFRYVREEECDLLVKKLKESASKQYPVNLSKTLFCLTGSIVSRTAFGQSFFENKHISEERVEELMLEAQKNMSLKFTDLFPTCGLGWFMDVVSGQLKRLHNVFNEIFTQDRPDFIDTVLEMIHKQEENESFKLTIDHLKGISTNIYLAGVDTSAITMIWAMAELVRNPRVMKKVLDEIRTCIGTKQNERLAEEEIDKLKYLKLVVKETLRLHPPAPLLLPRETMSQIKIQGYDITPKTILVINAWDPEEFIPERFIDSPVDYRGQSFDFLPFGSGRRICPGMASAMATIEMVLLSLLYYFDWSFPEEKKDVDMEEPGVVTVVKKVPLALNPSLHQ
ncbi:hypothetical protein Bca52824_030617 [Brassica carinata]|uniref:Uncharacterized protein n=1 Tax=Brassica carinata TaxID=52824 RepID=A0A8X7V5T1_BRACI|nr:hypothetical protein Bca52824_030617 [Brassica carinata]